MNPSTWCISTIVPRAGHTSAGLGTERRDLHVSAHYPRIRIISMMDGRDHVNLFCIERHWYMPNCLRIGASGSCYLPRQNLETIRSGLRMSYTYTEGTDETTGMFSALHHLLVVLCESPRYQHAAHTLPV